MLGCCDERVEKTSLLGRTRGHSPAIGDVLPGASHHLPRVGLFKPKDVRDITTWIVERLPNDVGSSFGGRQLFQQATLLQRLGQRAGRHPLARMAPELRHVGRSDAVPRAVRLPGRGTRSAWPWPIQPGLVRKRHGRVCRRSGSRDRGLGPQGHHDGGPLDWRRRGRALHRSVRHEASGQGGSPRGRAADHVEIGDQSGRAPHRTLRQPAERP